MLKHCRRYVGTEPLRRFYKEVTVQAKPEHRGFEILLDGRALRTPANNQMLIKSEPFALAIAHDYNSQQNVIRQDLMRLAGMCMTAIDNPLKQTNETLISKIMEHLEADTILHIDHKHERLRDMQRRDWGAVVRWANETLHLDLHQVDSERLAVPEISERASSNIIKRLSDFNRWSLVGFDYGADALKSVLLMLAATEYKIDVHKAVQLSLLEQRFQAEVWGEVDWAHNIDYHDLCSRVAAAVMFVECGAEQQM